jgi:serine/threonine protein kinase
MNKYPAGSLIAGRYEVASSPKMGGMGIVYFCLDRDNDNYPVALKTFKPKYVLNYPNRDLFLREAAVWINLGVHSHIVGCDRIFQDEVSLETFIVMELIVAETGRDDASLRSWLFPNSPLPTDQALLFAIQVARGMKYATKTVPNLIHRDLKPENVLVGGDKLPGWDINHVRVTDFGLAIYKSSSQTLPDLPPESSSGAGTINYMAPEQWRGHQLGAYTDMYALGCILIEMLTGKLAAPGRSVASLEIIHCNGHLEGLPITTPQVIREIVSKSTSIRPSSRYQDWGEFESELSDAYEALFKKAVPKSPKREDLGLGEDVIRGWSLMEIGVSYLDIDKIEIAHKYLDSALEISRINHDVQLQSTSIGNLGTLFLQMEDYPQALKCSEQQLELGRSINDQFNEASAMGNMSLAYFELGDHRHAFEYQTKALDIFRSINHVMGESSALGNLGELYRRLGKLKEAVGYYEDSVTLAHSIKDVAGEARSMLNLAILKGQQSSLSEALRLANQSLELFTSIGAEENIENVKKVISLLEDQMTNPSFPTQTQVNEAFKAFRQAGTLLGMLEAVRTYGFMVSEQFISAVEDFIENKAREEDKALFEEHLEWLKSIAETYA